MNLTRYIPWKLFEEIKNLEPKRHVLIIKVKRFAASKTRLKLIQKNGIDLGSVALVAK